MAWVAPVIGAGASILGDLMSQQGGQDTNATQMAIAQMNNQTTEYLAENAMSIRVADLKRAGLNPMLATGIGGAQVPSLQQPSLQNPSASFGNLGNQVSSAMQLASQQAQIRNTNAQAALTEAQTPGDVVTLNDDGSPDFTRASGGMLGNLSAASMAQSVRNAQATWDQIQQSIKQSQAQTSLTDVQTAIAGLDKGQLQATLQALIQKQLAETRITEANVPAAEAGAKIMQGNAGVWIKGIQTALGIAGQATSLAPGLGKALGGALRQPSTTFGPQPLPR